MNCAETREKTNTLTVAVIEDDPPTLEALVFQLGTAGFQAEPHPSAESFLSAADANAFDCIVADICLPRMNGLELLAEMRQSAPFVSIVFVTGRDDMALGVQAMREGAVDCLNKPADDAALLNAVRRGVDLCRMRRSDHMRLLELKERERTLTPREHQVFALITSGLLNKQVGAELGPAERTIKTHRGRVMKKMGADSLADLVRMAETLQVHATPKPTQP